MRSSPFQGGQTGSIPVRDAKNSSITQLVEYRVDNAEVVGSNPTGATRIYIVNFDGEVPPLKRWEDGSNPSRYTKYWPIAQLAERLTDTLGILASV